LIVIFSIRSLPATTIVVVRPPLPRHRRRRIGVYCRPTNDATSSRIPSGGATAAAKDDGSGGRDNDDGDDNDDDNEGGGLTPMLPPTLSIVSRGSQWDRRQVSGGCVIIYCEP
jgi:hypothetical protein